MKTGLGKERLSHSNSETASCSYLIDEYDVPLAKAFDYGYYDRMIHLIRNMFEQVLKTNDSLQFAVLTGCMRISKESIFTRLNNMNVLSVSDVEFDEYFGFTDREVRVLLEYYGLSCKYETTKEWYDGYQFGNVEVYCPWDVICYCNKLRSDPKTLPQNFWSNTSSNEVVRRFLEKAGTGTAKREIEKLVTGEVISKEIHQELTYKEMYKSIDNIWSVLFATGYLTQRGKPELPVIRSAVWLCWQIKSKRYLWLLMVLNTISSCFYDRGNSSGIALHKTFIQKKSQFKLSLTFLYIMIKIKKIALHMYANYMKCEEASND